MKAIRYMLLGSVLTLLVLSISAFAVRGSGTTLTVVERAENDTVTDTGAEGDSVGDVLTFANTVYDAKNETEINTDNGYCLRTVVGGAWECHWILTLENGQITVDGPFYDTGDSVLAITGGTGEYAAARGEMTLHFRNDAGTEFDFIYQISE